MTHEALAFGDGVPIGEGMRWVTELRHEDKQKCASRPRKAQLQPTTQEEERPEDHKKKKQWSR